ncbi:hypothetical protein J6590_049583 [Homalodisca vitripennis]|nr:hypothetical protein J6590_049581 [Homalodisca vitripennis]KAG8321275.1 hypothetical protein J6590_049583 [Homalodisca vitripennis]
MVGTGMTPAPYAAQFAQNGEAAGPLKAAEAGKEAPVVPGPPFSPPPATLPLNGIEQQTVSIVSTSCHFIVGMSNSLVGAVVRREPDISSKVKSYRYSFREL